MNFTTEHDILNFLYYDYFKREPRVTTDTRRIESGSVFFALKGASFDGNKFAKSALDAGCAYAVVDDAAVAAEDERIFCVPDALRALQNLAALKKEQGLSDDVFYHYDTPLTVEHEMDILRQAGFRDVRIMKQWGESTYTVLANKD